MFLAYSAINGFTLSIIMALYLQSTVLLAFLTTTVMFFAMGFIGGRLEAAHEKTSIPS